MNKKELKTVLKPLIRECIKDVIFEEGILSSLISEVLSATSKTTHVSEKRLVEQKRKEEIRENNELEQKTKIKLEETRKKMLDAIGKDSINGVNIFEGTEPLTKAGSPAASKVSSPLENYAPSDAGVDISEFFNPRWKNMV
tara:strand:+ start:1300 stop:1722 length:423 start_codon:yes stop_codon:yes gene_type:complete